MEKAENVTRLQLRVISHILLNCIIFGITFFCCKKIKKISPTCMDSGELTSGP